MQYYVFKLPREVNSIPDLVVNLIINDESKYYISRDTAKVAMSEDYVASKCLGGQWIEPYLLDEFSLSDKCGYEVKYDSNLYKLEEVTGYTYYNDFLYVLVELNKKNNIVNLESI